MKVEALEKMLDQKDSDAKLAAEIGQALLAKTDELNNEISRMKQRVTVTQELILTLTGTRLLRATG
jgi:hypothetical protein